MLTTAKSIQLLDASGLNISPITDITSLYYEVPNAIDNKVVSRKYVYDGFPVGVNITNDGEASVGVALSSEGRHPAAGHLYINGNYRKIVNGNGKDILVSNVSTSVIPGTTYRLIDIYNYNLSDILSYYTPLDLMDASIKNINSSIDIINSSISDLSTRVTNISTGLYAGSLSLLDLLNLGTIGALIPNKFYLINNYYVSLGSDGCMALPNPDTNFSGPDNSSSLSLLVKANDAYNLDYKLYNMYDHDGNSLNVYGTYKLELENKPLIQIIQLKDKYGNEAPYDFYNLKYNSKYTFNRGNDSSNYLLVSNTIKNNIIKSNPFTTNNQILICTNNNPNIQNNYIDANTNINADCSTSEEFTMLNNTIYNNCSIYIQPIRHVEFNNNIIKSNNIINIFTLSNNATDNIFNNNIIGSNNIINIYLNALSRLTVNVSNNITLFGNTAANVTILDNCNASINLKSNVIIDSYDLPSTTLSTSPNCVYFFKQNVYAKSFNTLK